MPATLPHMTCTRAIKYILYRYTMQHFAVLLMHKTPACSTHSTTSITSVQGSTPDTMQDAALLQDMCGETWIPRSSLHNWRPLGSGAFAVVQQCVLRLDSGLKVNCCLHCLLSGMWNRQLQWGPEEYFKKHCTDRCMVLVFHHVAHHSALMHYCGHEA